MGLQNRVALVTGATSEIGYAYVKYLLLNRVKVLLCDVYVDKCRLIVEELLKEFQNISLHSVKCDVTNEDEFENAFKTCMKHFGRLDIVVNNAGVFEHSIEQWSTMVNINYGGIVKGTLLAIKYMGIPNGGNGGTVIQTTSSMVDSDTFHYAPMFKSTKRCVMEFTKTFGGIRNFSLHGIKIISLCPGLTGTTHFLGMANKNEGYVEDNKDFNKQLLIQKPDHVGRALIYVLEHGKTGDTWIVENNKPPRLVVN